MSKPNEPTHISPYPNIVHTHPTNQPNWTNLAADLLGTHGYPEGVLEDNGALDWDEDDIDEELLDHGIEKCSVCGWWVESGEVVDEDGEIVPCGNCSW